MVRLPLGRFCIESFYLTVRFRPSERYGKGAAERIIRRGFPLGSAPVTAVQFSHANGQPLLGVRATRIYSASQFRIRKCRASVLSLSNFRSTLLSRNWHRSLKKTAFSSLRAEGVPSHETSCSGSRKSDLRAQSEESLRVLRSLGSECCQTHAAKVRDECSSLADERGFATFGTVWCRREIGGPSFDHDSLDWD
jgi:hypothetical protein